MHHRPRPLRSRPAHRPLPNPASCWPPPHAPPDVSHSPTPPRLAFLKAIGLADDEAAKPPAFTSAIAARLSALCQPHSALIPIDQTWHAGSTGDLFFGVEDGSEEEDESDDGKSSSPATQPEPTLGFFGGMHR